MWKLIPTGKGLLSEKEYVSRTIEFEMKVIAHIQRDRADAPETREFKKCFDLTFEVRGFQRVIAYARHLIIITMPWCFLRVCVCRLTPGIFVIRSTGIIFSWRITGTRVTESLQSKGRSQVDEYRVQHPTLIPLEKKK